ncbi:hypothetical protein L2E82_18896 [Cichorium intybus]|uniref:Uncharacterized protein n=1 Tax=Cichorium intybus TaxID=13427 RepID=A0ACB9FBV6_CICIN|nr:hypothetical protein L2E82_18896 [Cichorium intybus]
MAVLAPKQEVELSVKSENFEEAARIRDSLKSFEEEDPVLCLRGLMREAIATEKFEDAARYRDQIKEIAPHYLLKCSSDATTLGIRVQVRSLYIGGRSQPLRGQYFFAYRIRITNNSTRPVQLLKRHWIITNANEKSENVWCIGVIGYQAVILPNNSFEYSLACPLTTPNGRMIRIRDLNLYLITYKTVQRLKTPNLYSIRAIHLKAVKQEDTRKKLIDSDNKEEERKQIWTLLSGIMRGQFSQRPRGTRTVFPLALIQSLTRELSCQIHEEARKFSY